MKKIKKTMLESLIVVTFLAGMILGGADCEDYEMFVWSKVIALGLMLFAVCLYRGCERYIK